MSIEHPFHPFFHPMMSIEAMMNLEAKRLSEIAMNDANELSASSDDGFTNLDEVYKPFD
jgi:hypothetical protein